MSKTAILVENVSKSYQMGVINTGTFRGDLKRWWARQRGEPDPFLKIGEEEQDNIQGETLWALRDINFQVQQGEALGIIGRNGAGKSTLLKILSRVTAPTNGVARVKGRIASLLEVGTGFHPELTGSENIYLNGAILGMSKAEIRRKFDEIVNFSGVEKFINTPVKRYSSGMYVRLAFAVAAHLEPEILIVDEVLAVGDFEFQKKCLGKMSDVTHEGRTVLFVSHNTSAVKSLCNRGIVLVDGSIAMNDTVENAVNYYFDSAKSKNEAILILPPPTYPDPPGTGKQIQIMNSVGVLKTDFYINEPFKIEFEFEIFRDTSHVIAASGLFTSDNTPIISYWSYPKDLTAGRYKCSFIFNLPLSSMAIQIGIGLTTNEQVFYYVPSAGNIKIVNVALGQQPYRTSGRILLGGQNSTIQEIV
jgi:lipopolysaccharide transport system ATP-binding protein